ncbi:hypothetical protein KC326_g219 [Hortaea werneckii]|nr:hypothetical protein KC326_g219 [Hortaea werneckii]
MSRVSQAAESVLPPPSMASASLISVFAMLSTTFSTHVTLSSLSPVRSNGGKLVRRLTSPLVMSLAEAVAAFFMAVLAARATSSARSVRYGIPQISATRNSSSYAILSCPEQEIVSALVEMAKERGRVVKAAIEFCDQPEGSRCGLRTHPFHHRVATCCS